MLKGLLTISNVTGEDDSAVHIRVYDSLSQETFVTIVIDHEQFSKVITGLSRQPVVFETVGLEHVGQQKETMELEFPIGDSTIEKAAMKACPDGWEPHLYFGSIRSKFKRDDADWGRTVAFRWVDVVHLG